jgi:hypothetical protein
MLLHQRKQIELWFLFSKVIFYQSFLSRLQENRVLALILERSRGEVGR